MNLIKKVFVLGIIFFLGFGRLFSFQLQEKQQPNIILIVADDLGFADLSMNGSKQIKTPHIDNLAVTGVNFTEGYVSSAVCSPSRAGFLTGRNQVEFGHDNNIGVHQIGFDPAYQGLPIEVKTIADYLKALDYTTGLVGKWHLGDAPHFHPLKRGFDEFWGYTGGGHDYFISKPNGTGYSAPIECNYKTPNPITYITDDVGDECVGFIKRNKQTPFFLFASFNAPHNPMQATKEDLELYKDIKEEKRRTYAAMVHRLDINVGKITKALEKEGLLDNTLLVFISDNGGPPASNAANNTPYRGQKGTLLEGGIHVPYIMSWPNGLPKGEVYNKPVSSLDFAPTFIKMAGGEISGDEKFSGVDLLPFLKNRKSTSPHNILKWRFTISKAIRKGPWKLISLPDRLPMLYNLDLDISEKNDVFMKNIGKAEELLKLLGNWDVNLPHPVFLEDAVYKHMQLSWYDKEFRLTHPE